ncbi:MAG: hypothetical protein HQ526_11030, partial [Actinobacteria bacterium]|nr:hypothetical protein [Actinomycetota bacterium]
HVVHQFAFWLQRILGLRISEAFGLRIGHILPQGNGRDVVVVREQGGRRFAMIDRRSGQMSSEATSTTLKSACADRIIVVPKQMKKMIDGVIAVFHTDAEGRVDPDRRLIPGLTRAQEAGQEAFRSALAKAGQQAAIDLAGPEAYRYGAQGSYFESHAQVSTVLPHDLRKAIATDVGWNPSIDPLARRRMLGHARGVDVHERVYILDHPEMKSMVKIARKIEKLIKADVPNGLLIPTRQRCTTKNQPALVPIARKVDSALMDLGWLVSHDERGASVLTSVDVAAVAGVANGTARRWMREGVIPSFLDSSGKRFCHLEDVTAFISRFGDDLDLNEISEELGETYAYLYQLLKARDLSFRRVGNRIAVPRETQRALVAHLAVFAELEANALSIESAADRLGLPVTLVERLIRTGQLAVLDARGRNNRRYVSFEEIARFEQSSSARGRRRYARRNRVA